MSRSDQQLYPVLGQSLVLLWILYWADGRHTEADLICCLVSDWILLQFYVDVNASQTWTWMFSSML